MFLKILKLKCRDLWVTPCIKF
uniref:Uncharacterized protein n=1 Tax=Rhizophora mucronata TaxID=61149 RepID=A0A2P2PHA6_RHIMU